MAQIMTLQDLIRAYQNSRQTGATSDAAIPLQPGMPGYGQDNFNWELQNNLSSGTWKDLGGGNYELPDVPKESGLDAFMNSPGLPLAVFGAGMGATGGFSDLMSSFNSPGGMSSTISETSAPTQVGGATAEYGGPTIGNEGDWYGGIGGEGATPSMPSSTIGNEGDWWTGMPSGTTEATPGGGGSTLGAIGDWLGKVTPGQWLGAGGTLLGSGLNYLGATNAAKTQAQGAQGQQDLLKYMYDQNRADLAPWREAGVGALGNLTNLTTPGKQFDTAMLDPGYQFRQQQGEQGINRAAAARGLWDSGRTYKALDRFNQDYATGEFNNVYNRNANLAGLGQTAVGQGVQAGQTYGQNAGESMLQAANARASGYVGGANALSGGLSSLINNYQQQAMLDKIFGRG